MTVLHLISSGGMYGAEAVILNLSRVLNAGAEHRSILGVFDNGTPVAQQLPAAARAAGVDVHAIPVRGQIDTGLPARLRSLVQSTGADVVHAHGYKADVYALLALRGASRRALVSTCHTWYDNDLAVRLYGALDRRALRSFDGVVTVSEEVRSRLLGAGVRPERIRLIRNGVDLRPFVAAANQRSERVNDRPLRVGLAGRLSPEKGIEIFLQAIAQWRSAKNSASAGVEFVVVGEGPERSRLEALQNELGLNEQVTLAGHNADMPSFYASVDLLVSSSRQEGLPIALLEGMASGLPLLATAVGEVPQLASNGTTALLVPPNDVSALAAGLRQLIDDPALRERLGRAGQQLIAAEFSAEAMAAEYLDLYRAVEQAPRRAYAEGGQAAQVR